MLSSADIAIDRAARIHATLRDASSGAASGSAAPPPWRRIKDSLLTEASPRALACSPDGKFVAALYANEAKSPAGLQLAVFQEPDWRKIYGHDHVASVAWHPQHPVLAIGVQNTDVKHAGDTLWFYHPAQHDRLAGHWFLEKRAPAEHLAWSGDGQTLIGYTYDLRHYVQFRPGTLNADDYDISGITLTAPNSCGSGNTQRLLIRACDKHPIRLRWSDTMQQDFSCLGSSTGSGMLHVNRAGVTLKTKEHGMPEYVIAELLLTPHYHKVVMQDSGHFRTYAFSFKNGKVKVSRMYFENVRKILGDSEPGQSRTMQASRDGKLLAIGHDHRVSVVDGESGRFLWTWPFENSPWSLAWSHDSRKLFVGESSGVQIFETDFTRSSS